ncbi:MAG: hypothetical protein WA708_13230 [Acidobacteriaceae bacterium]
MPVAEAKGEKERRRPYRRASGLEPDWLSLWAFARQDLKLTSAEFYALTPRQFDALAGRHRQTVEHGELLFAQLTAWVVNTGFRSTKRPVQAKDFMPSQSGAQKPRKRKRLRSRQAIADEIRATMAHFLKK